jgi:hypothetical protein
VGCRGGSGRGRGSGAPQGSLVDFPGHFPSRAMRRPREANCSSRTGGRGLTSLCRPLDCPGRGARNSAPRNPGPAPTPPVRAIHTRAIGPSASYPRCARRSSRASAAGRGKTGRAKRRRGCGPWPNAFTQAFNPFLSTGPRSGCGSDPGAKTESLGKTAGAAPGAPRRVGRRPWHGRAAHPGSACGAFIHRLRMRVPEGYRIHVAACPANDRYDRLAGAVAHSEPRSARGRPRQTSPAILNL